MTVEASTGLSASATTDQAPILGLTPAQVAACRDAFAAATPFKYAMVDGFFGDAFARALLADFPSFDPAKAMNEFGEVGGKAVHERIDAISPAYARLYAWLNAAPFLTLMSEISGIPALMADPNMYGGGTHENLHGQDLDPHVDFNVDPVTKLHRRLNLLVYLNEEWDEAWGGAIELHSNPRRPRENVVTAFAPSFNRAVLFETNEYSWHGFPRIELPADKRHLSRKSLSVYLYSRERPAEEIVPEHGTFYVQRHLATHIRPGHMLSEADVAEIWSLLSRRDAWLEHYQKEELRVSGYCGELHEQLRRKSRGPFDWLRRKRSPRR